MIQVGWVRLTLAVIVIAAALHTPRIEAAVAERELRAREAFAVGKYQEALELFAKLYAEKPHANYLRNIGRCYQNLGEPDKAITSFRDYLRNAKGITPAERQEVEGYIKEMEDLKVKRQATIGTGSGTGSGSVPGGDPAPGSGGAVRPLTSPPPPAGGNTTAPIVPAATEPTPATSATPNLQVTETAGSTAPADQTSAVYERWWFWAIVGGVVAAGLGTAAALGAFTTTEDAKCPTGVRC